MRRVERVRSCVLPMQTVLQKWTADGRFARLFGPHGIETVQHPAAFGAAVSAELRPLYRAGERND